MAKLIIYVCLLVHCVCTVQRVCVYAVLLFCTLVCLPVRVRACVPVCMSACFMCVFVCVVRVLVSVLRVHRATSVRVRGVYMRVVVLCVGVLARACACLRARLYVCMLVYTHAPLCSCRACVCE